mmetsp:Transcript_89302/g.142177  ORF Transcript_89302/g.142177 Transcript_89302/m.142177 type:complete len:177 (-) Transcript_89302:29-559(-)
MPCRCRRAGSLLWCILCQCRLTCSPSSWCLEPRTVRFRYVVVFVTLSVVFFSANTKVGAEMKARKSVFQRFAGGVTDFAAAQGIKMKNRGTVRPMSKGSDGPLFTKEMEGMGRKISQTSVLSAGEIYDAEDKPLAVQPRKTHVMNDAFFEADRSWKGYCVRCVRCCCACCRGRARY